MKIVAKNISLFLAVFFVLGLSFIPEARAKHKNNKSDSDFEEFKVPIVRCSETTMLCGLGPTSPLLGTDPLTMTEGSRARIKKKGRLEVKVEGAVPNKSYDVLFVFTPGADPSSGTLTLLFIGSFTTDSKGKGKFEADVSGFLGETDSVHVMITDHDGDTTQIGDVPRQFITGVKIR
jgi:hypothetical protein